MKQFIILLAIHLIYSVGFAQTTINQKGKVRLITYRIGDVGRVVVNARLQADLTETKTNVKGEFVYSVGFAQTTINQKGKVRLITYCIGDVGRVVENACLRADLTETKTNVKGEFVVSVKKNPSNVFRFSTITHPNYNYFGVFDIDYKSKEYPINEKVPVEIVMVDPAGHKAELARVEKNLVAKHERIKEEMEAKIREKNDTIKALRAENREIAPLVENRMKMIEDLRKYEDRYCYSDVEIRQQAEELSRIDFQSLDSIQALITYLRKEGRDEEATKVSDSRGNPDDIKRVESNPENFRNEINTSEDKIRLLQANIELEKKKIEVEKDSIKLYASIFFERSVTKANRNENDSAAYWLERRMLLDNNNYQFSMDYGRFIDQYLAYYNNALTIYQHCLALAKRQLGEAHPDVATIYINMGLVYDSQGDYSKALHYYEQSLAICKQVHGEAHPAVATSYYNMGGVYSSQGDYSKALHYYEQSLAIFADVLGESHPNTKQVKANLDYLHNSKNNLFYYNAEIQDGGVAYEQGLRGKYRMLFFEGFEIGSKENLYVYIPKVKEKPKRVVLMDEKGDIQLYHFDAGLIGIMFEKVVVTKEEEEKLIKQYNDWIKRTNFKPE